MCRNTSINWNLIGHGGEKQNPQAVACGSAKREERRRKNEFSTLIITGICEKNK
jgi:hypothetical protein